MLFCTGYGPFVAVASTTITIGEELHSLAEEVVEVLKGLAGREAFARSFAAVQKEVADVRESRKRRKALDVSSSTLIWCHVPCSPFIASPACAACRL